MKPTKPILHDAGKRPWHWPFEGRRLVTIRGLRVALFTMVLGLLVRAALSAFLPLTELEREFLSQAQHLDMRDKSYAPLAHWLWHPIAVHFSDNSFILRLPSIIAALTANLILLRVITRFGWAKGAGTATLLFHTMPATFYFGLHAGPQMMLLCAWLALVETSYLIRMSGQRLGISHSLAPRLLFLCIIATLIHPYGGLAALTALVSSNAAVHDGAIRKITMGMFLATLPAAYFGHPLARLTHWNEHAPYLALLYLPALIGIFFLIGRHGARLRQSMGGEHLAIWTLLPAPVLLTLPLLYGVVPLYAMLIASLCKPSELERWPRVARIGMRLGAALTLALFIA